MGSLLMELLFHGISPEAKCIWEEPGKLFYFEGSARHLSQEEWVLSGSEPGEVTR